MESNQVGKVRSFFSEKRRSRRAAAQQATAVPEATPGADAYDPATKADMLFVQSFRSGSIEAREGEGAYTVTLQHDLGETIYFSDRPERIVGATSTAQFMRGFGFSPESPANAALVITKEDGGADFAIVELTNPSFDEASATATYDLQLLENFGEINGRLQADPVDLADVAASFGVAHLFIDDCADDTVYCIDNGTGGQMPLATGFATSGGSASHASPTTTTPRAPA